MDLAEIWQAFFETYYAKAVNELATRYCENGKKPSLVVDWMDLYKFSDGILARKLDENPDEALAMASIGLSRAHNIQGVELKNVAIRISNPPTIKKKSPRDVRVEDKDKFIAIEGLVTAVSEVIPVALTAEYVCHSCGTSLMRKYSYHEPMPKFVQCPKCKKRTAKLEQMTSKDFQFGKIQDFPEKLKATEQPTILEIVLDEGLVGQLNPGERVCLTGILRVKSKGYSDLRKYFEVNYIHKYDKLGIKLTKEDVEKIKAFARQGNVLERLSKCIAPSILGLDHVKKAIVLQMIGGSEVVRKDGTVKRGNIHILLIGNPATGKSELLRSVKQLAPRAVYVVATRASKVGLTATIEKDELTKRKIIVAGALVLGSDGITCIDEFEKLDKNDIKALNEAMEQQTVTVTLQGTNFTLNAKSAVLASANPKREVFNEYENIWEQISIPPSTLSRFDLVFILFGNDSRDVVYHILDIAEKESVPDVEVTPEFFTKYIVYARKIKIEEITQEAREALAEFYEAMKSVGKSYGVVSITLRQLLALIRLAEASAKARLSKVVEKCDADVAIELMKKSLEYCVDPELGVYDATTLEFGIPKSLRDKIEVVKEIIAELEDKNEVADEETLLDIAESRYGISRGKVYEILEKLKEKGEIYSPRYGQYRLVRS